MVKARWTAGLVTAGLVLMGWVLPASAQTGDRFDSKYNSRQEDIDAILKYQPRQEGVEYGRPSPDEQKACTMKLILGDRPNSSGWLLLDPQGRPLRRFFDSNGDRNIDVWSYYKEGVEVYREFCVSVTGNADQLPQNPNHFRWLGGNGSKYGVDLNADLKIDTWRMISSEEAAQEAYLAVTKSDLNRLKALLISEAEMQSLKLPEGQVARIRDAISKAPEAMKELLAKQPALKPGGAFKSVEPAIPQCVPTAAKGPAQDLLQHPNRAILYETFDKKHEWLHTGEMILVGQSWKLTGAPSLTDGPTEVSTGTGANDPALKKLMDDLLALDKNQPGPQPLPGKYAVIAEYNVKRAALLEQIIAKTTDAKEKETWVRQILDNLCTGHQASLGGDNSLLLRLAQHKEQIAKSAPGTGLAGYAHYREIWARFAADLAGVGTNKDAVKTQRDWQEELTKFVQLYPKADDTPDALGQLAMGSEYGGKDKQDEAKKYWSLLATNFPEHPLAPRARGAAKRLELNGQKLELSGPTLQGGQIDIAKMSSKVVVVYYWSTTAKSTCVGELAQMKQLLTTYGSKGLEIVTVNLDDKATDAQAFLTASQITFPTLFLATELAKGLDSPLALQYGIVGVPTIFLVGKDGRVIDRSIQVNELEDAIKKAIN
jgi:peroxiredoxin